MAEPDPPAVEPAATDDTGGSLEPKGNQRAVIDSRAACTSVDAGAGTGKTTTMLLRIEDAIERGVDPADVLVLTFANEAAASIRAAVSERLEPATAAEIDVYTYHSFCYGLVREYAYYLGLSPDVDVVTESGRRRLVERLLADREYEFADEAAGGAEPTALAADVDRFVAAMSREDVEPAELAAGLPDVRTLEFLGEFVLWLEREADRELSFDNEALRYFNRPEHLEAARESLIGYGKLLTYCREKIAEAPAAVREEPVVRDVEAYLRVLQECVTHTVEALSLEEPTTKQLPRALFGNEIGRNATSRIEQTPVGRLRHYVSFLRQARHYTDVYADYRAHLEREGQLDFDELVRTATRLLADDSRDGVAEEITNRWTQVYCDEFQDTDETQFALITELTAGEDRPDLLAIGDKDQAIYGWRGTDREGLDRLARVYDDHAAVELELNFRSRQEILDVTNHCEYGRQTSKTLREHGRAPGEYDERAPPTRVATVESDELEWSTPEQVATTVSRLLNGEIANVPRRTLGDIAVIVRTNRHAQAVADELRALQIPHEISGSPRGEISPGMQTLVSYLRVLVEPSADAHLRRMLLYRYRLPEADLERLQAHDGSLGDALQVIDLETAAAHDRLEQAREHLRTLERLRDVLPRGEFLRRFRELTRLEWFLTSEERTELDRVDRFVDAYDDGTVLGALTERFVDALERTLRGNETGLGRGSNSADRVDVMTVHQAKGLQFDTVLVPFLSDEEWCVERDYAARARYRLLSAALDDGIDSPLCADLAAETVGEEWRVLHVALTRAENHLFLFGSRYDYDGGEGELAASTAQSCLAEAIEWSVTGERMDLWDAVTDSVDRVRETYPETVADLTDELAVSAGGAPGTITYYAGYGDRPVEPLETREAIATVHRLGRLLRRDILLPAADAADALATSEGIDLPATRHAGALTPETTRFPVTTLARATELPVALRHSYTAVRTHETCARKHYLDHVVRAIDDPSPGGDGSARLVGTVFHDIAEEAFYRGYETAAAWHEAARRQLTARGLLEHREPVAACIDRYFEARAASIDEPVAEWEALAAELPFSLADVPGVDGTVVGSVDSVRRTPAGDLVVLDYKATAERIEPAAATQLRLYARACDRRFDDPVEAVGYVYVGEGAGPHADLYDPAALPSWESVRTTLEAVDDPSFAETTPGAHCRFCPHRSLGCGPEEFVLEDVIDTE
ncbi:UvrD-helicase domain-containing protein [Natrononativus amylolyticus]|uniref:UvrD-helicase domain-containing protein n=1 Tax=Natrononativus amylolyticus TaxID=2963434 RepID=UPI0020CF7C54|nr:UvrD-helicase domain-containing protein [Natrononativus amylolyticus]